MRTRLLACCLLLVASSSDAVTREDVRNLCAQLAPPATGGDREARVALKAAVDQAARFGAESQQKIVAAAVADALNAATDAEIQDFLLEYLRFVAKETEIPAAAKFLLHDRLSDQAIAVLVTVGGPAAERALLAALPKANAAQAAALIQALGDIGSTAEIPNASLYTLARSGTARAGQLLKTRDAAAYLRYGERLAELGQSAQAAAVASDLLKGPVAVRCGALALLAATKGSEALPALMNALDDGDPSVREQAVRLLARLKRDGLSAELAAAARAAKGAKRAALLDAVSRRADNWSPGVFAEALNDEDAAVHSAAIEGLKRVGGASGARALLAWLGRPAQESANHGEKPAGETPVPLAAEARAALIAMRGDGVDAEIAKQLAAPATRVIALELLTKRRATLQTPAIVPLVSDPDPKVAQAACDALAVLAGGPELEQLVAKALASDNAEFRQRVTKPILSVALRLTDTDRSVKLLLATLPGAKPETRDWILSLLPVFGGPAALDAVVAETKVTDEAARLAGVRALADWRDGEAIQPLLVLTRTGADERTRVLAARGAARIIEQADLDKAEKVQLMGQLLEAAPRDEEKQLVQAALQRVESQANKSQGKKKK